MKTKFKQNVDVIKLLKQLEAEGRMATPSEQKILAKFNGWGTLAAAFSNSKGWQAETEQLRELLTPEEYKAARAAINNAFYTDPKIAQTIWSGLERLGFTGGRILDPSMGSGIFFGTMSAEMTARSELSGVELDSLTGRIAKQLYQQADIEITGFQNRALPNNYFDLAISNVPFADTRILEDPAYRKENLMLHDYFFAKAMDKVRPGGLVAFITSTGTLNNPAQIAKLYDGKADLIAAYKLPSNTFEKNAGTQVTTDVVIFQKRFDPNKPSEYAQSWTTVSKDFPAAKKGSDETKPVKINEYFQNHPDHMIGTPTLDTLWSGGNRLALDGTGRDVAKELGELMKNLPENIYTPIKSETQSAAEVAKSKLATMQRDGLFTAEDGKIYRKQEANVEEITGEDSRTVKDYLSLQKNLDALLTAQLDPTATDEKLSELRKLLNQKYDAFTKNHGCLNAPKNLKLLSADPNFGRVAAIENYQPGKKNQTESAAKADIFFRRTGTPQIEPTTAETAFDGLTVSLAYRGRVDMNYIANLTGKSESELERELQNFLYRNPATNQLEIAEEYLSGKVREKLAEAQAAAEKNPKYKRNVEALQKIQPAYITEEGITAQIGATWIEPKYYEDFARHLVGESFKDVKVRFSPTLGKWIVDKHWGDFWRKEYQQWTVQKSSRGDVDFFDLLQFALNKVTPTFTTTDETGKKFFDEAPSMEARAKVEQIGKAFEEWLWSDETRKKELLDSYNSEFTGTVLRTYDGSHLTFPGLAPDVREKLYPHQKDAIWRVMQGKNTLLAHCVGAGKTWEMVISAMEMKRVGMINKPLFVVPNAITEQFRNEFLAAYPSARILTLTSKNLPAVGSRDGRTLRAQTLSKVATNDWDGIIISHELFRRLPVSPEAQNSFIRQELSRLEEEKTFAAQLQSKNTDTTKFVKEIERAQAKLKQRILRNVDESRKEICISFDELGIDQMFVDEADLFKNLKVNTQFAGRRAPGAPKVVGVSVTTSQRSEDMFMKTQLLTKMRNGGGQRDVASNGRAAIFRQFKIYDRART